MARREFTRAVYAQIVHRAMVGGEIACEGCGLVLGKKPYHVDHTIPDALQVDKTRKLTCDDGKLLGVECCHKPKTVADQGNIAEAKRREAKHLGITFDAPKMQGRPFPKSTQSAKREAKASGKLPLPARRLFAPVEARTQNG